MNAKTARYEAVSGLSKTRVSGVIDFPRGYATLHTSSHGGIDMAMLRRGSRLYLRDGTSGAWCVQSNNTAIPHGSPPSGISALMHSLVPVPPKGSHPRYVGSDLVRGITTSHFHLGGPTPVDLWVDGRGLLRRVSEHSATVPFIEDYFDYGVNVTFAGPAPTSPECERG